MNLYKNTIVLLSIILFYSNCSATINTPYADPRPDQAVRIEVKNVDELHALNPNPGDTIYLVDSLWENSQITLKGIGTADKPIVFRVADPQKTSFSKNSNLTIDGEWIIADGFVFKDGFSTGKDVIIFSKKSSHCTLKNTAILDYNPDNKEVDYKWVSLYGTHNAVVNCEFTGKTHSGTTLVVWLDENPNHHIITRNYFGHRPELGTNGGETIRIGTSHWSMHSSNTLVINNIFDNCDGEIEIISVKSCHNTIEDNLFYECSGTLTLRHGNDNIIRNNFFIGNEKANSGGIRVIGERHLVEGNYLYKLKGKSLRASLSIMNAVENPELNAYFQVQDAQVKNNIVVGCAEGIIIGAGANTTRTVVPKNLTIQGNILQNVSTVIKYEAQPIGLSIDNNQTNASISENGFLKLNELLEANEYGIYTDMPAFWLDKSNKIGPDGTNLDQTKLVGK
ncbi:polysaccharide lyase 6 family protein [Sphingobacterium sp. FBM7-1]|uniref:polysaccharide lyase 6 family protein n=1 Tax=Sphingobacterium sp. FBM7-1 TaxID=2886688 RepID=UPI001D121563|nr:polysaccharide lyase 6 family protein [Sphingobacterium sp. FBM7-1]MCC2600159.1 polysaccharide lyase 6 family protein [Sphingobacterium sp. FBM7-1]